MPDREPLGVTLARDAAVGAHRLLYAGLARRLIFRMSAPQTHVHLLRLLRWSDAQEWLLPLLDAIHHVSFRPQTVRVGGVTLDSPLILAAGLVKGEGFASEQDACAAAARGENIIPGWRSLPPLVGPVEFGSFTRWPRLGNDGITVWRDVPTRSSQNRIGLRNPGARAAADFLAARRALLPQVYGINLAVSPGVDDAETQRDEVVAALHAFLERGVIPAWLTLNLSCPNTEDDPRGHQTADQARTVCGAAADVLRVERVPLWVKLGPTLAEDQYRALLPVLAEIGVRAVVATNTLPEPAPGDAGTVAGVAGGRLHARAVEVAALLAREIAARGYRLDLIGCGGVQDGATYRAFVQAGARAVQYWTALIYRGPLAAALIAHEGEN